jgi:hypothetical protein
MQAQTAQSNASCQVAICSFQVAIRTHKQSTAGSRQRAAKQTCIRCLLACTQLSKHSCDTAKLPSNVLACIVHHQEAEIGTASVPAAYQPGTSAMRLKARGHKSACDILVSWKHTMSAEGTNTCSVTLGGPAAAEKHSFTFHTILSIILTASSGRHGPHWQGHMPGARQHRKGFHAGCRRWYRT